MSALDGVAVPDPVSIVASLPVDADDDDDNSLASAWARGSTRMPSMALVTFSPAALGPCDASERSAA